MNVSGTSNAYLYDLVNLSGKSGNYSSSAIAQPASATNYQDAVTISAQGKALADQTPEGLKRLALPAWIVDYTPGVNIFNGDTSPKTGYVAQTENYRDTYKNEMIEFGKIFNDAFAAAKAEHGIVTQGDMYERVIKDPGFSETLRQAVDEKVTAVPRAVELMNILGLR